MKKKQGKKKVKTDTISSQKISFLEKNKDLMNKWEKGFYSTIKSKSFKNLTQKEYYSVIRVLKNLGFYPSKNKYSGLDAWTKIENSNMKTVIVTNPSQHTQSALDNDIPF